MSLSSKNFDEFLNEASDAAEDRVGEINALLAGAREGDDGDDTRRKLLQGAHSLKSLGASFGIPVLRALAHRLEDYADSCTTLDEASLADLQAIVDRIAAAIEGDLEADPAQVADIVRALPGRRSSFSADDVEVRDVEVMLVMEPGTAMRFVSRELEECGYRMVNVWSTVDALQLAAAMRPDLIIVSNVMRDLTGVDLACAIRAMPATRGIRVAVLTSEQREKAALADLPPDVPILSKSTRFADDVTEVFTSFGLL